MFSKACKYAIRAVLYLAVHTDVKKKLGAKEVATAIDVPKHFLAKILQQLSRQDLIASIKGPNGGFYLPDEKRNITIAQIIECIDGRDTFSSCVLGLPVCSEEKPCPLHIHAFTFRESLKYQLRHQSIDELAHRINKEGIQI